MRQFTITLTEYGRQGWTAQALNKIGTGQTAWHALKSWKNSIVTDACDDYILAQKLIEAEVDKQITGTDLKAL